MTYQKLTQEQQELTPKEKNRQAMEAFYARHPDFENGPDCGYDQVVDEPRETPNLLEL